MTISGPPTALTALTVSGVPTIGTGGLPPFTGNYYFCDYANGDDGNTGQADNPFKTIGRAYDLATAGNNDVIFIIGDGSTAATQRLSAQLVWAKDATHLIGLTAPALNQRARISTASDATTNIANLLDISASGCIFANWSMFQGVGEAATAEQMVRVSGSRNYFGNISFLGMGSVAGASETASYTLKLYGAEENVFDTCYFGADTRDRDETNTNVQLRKNASNTACTRNEFRNCVFAMYATDTDPSFVDCNEAGSLDRFTLFDNCAFINTGTGTAAAVVAGKTDQGGKIILRNCGMAGASEWGSLSNNAAILVIGTATTDGNTSGKAVNSNPS